MSRSTVVMMTSLTDRVTQSQLTLAHAEWREDQSRRQHDLKLWGMWFREAGGPEAWGSMVEAVRA